MNSARKRFIYRGEAAVWCPGGRWGPRRTRTNECQLVIRAEDLYTALIREAAKGRTLAPGCAGTVSYQFQGRCVSANWEVRANALWRFGRVFFRCSRCGQLSTRLYVPLAESGFGCRRCWGLSYSSTGLQNYKDSIWGRGPLAAWFGTTQRDWAYMTTNDRRKDRTAAADNRNRLRARDLRKIDRALAS
jgi:hypothetical protein